MKDQEFGISDRFHSYEFVTPWLALNQENYVKYYGLKNRDERHELIRKTLIANLLSMSKSLDYRVPDEIKCDVQGKSKEKQAERRKHNDLHWRLLRQLPRTRIPRNREICIKRL